MRNKKFKGLTKKEIQTYREMLQILLLLEIQHEIIKVFRKSLDFKEVKNEDKKDKG